MAFKVPAHQLSKLIEKLTPCLPMANRVCSTAKRAKSGTMSANFYTDRWPDFTTVVCHILSPALSEEGDVIAYSTCKENLLKVIQESGVLTWSSTGWQLLEACIQGQKTCKLSVRPYPGLEAPFAEYLLENLKPPPGKENLKPKFMYEAARYVFLGDINKHPYPSDLPEEFFVEELKPEHAAFLTQHWYPEVLARPIKVHHYFSTTIDKCHSIGVFQTTDPTNPISWTIQHNHGQLGHGYTLKEFSGMGLVSICGRIASQRVVDDGDLIEITIDENDEAMVNLVNKFGLTKTCNQKSFSIGLA